MTKAACDALTSVLADELWFAAVAPPHLQHGRHFAVEAHTLAHVIYAKDRLAFLEAQ